MQGEDEQVQRRQQVRPAPLAVPEIVGWFAPVRQRRSVREGWNGRPRWPTRTMQGRRKSTCHQADSHPARGALQEAATIGLDLAKASVHFVWLDARGQVLTRRRYSEGNEDGPLARGHGGLLQRPSTLRLVRLRAPADQRQTGAIHEQILPRLVVLQHDRVLPCSPLAVQPAEPAVAVPVGILLPALQPPPLRGQALPRRQRLAPLRGVERSARRGAPPAPFRPAPLAGATTGRPSSPAGGSC